MSLYTIRGFDNFIIGAYPTSTFVVFTLEEFLEKFPYKVGDKVLYKIYNVYSSIKSMTWNEEKEQVIYRLDSPKLWVATADEIEKVTMEANEKLNPIMEQKDKDLLLQDLCARLPYKVKASYYGVEEECECWDEVEYILNDYVYIGQYSLPIECIKPYLFPLSSITEEQRKELQGEHMKDAQILINIAKEVCINKNEDKRALGITHYAEDWCNKNYFDYRGLIEKGLAIDCTKLKIY